jgi:Ser/Thr protein kinase RdoA (MazF antagonist)/membrane-associated phospholipid phosphatase
VAVGWEFGTVIQFDRLMFSTLNSVVGRSPSLDLTLIFLSENSGDFLLVGVIAAAIIGLLRRDKHRPLSIGNYAAAILYFGGITAVTYLLVEASDNYVSRPSPGAAVEAFRNPGSSFGIDWHPSRLSRFPSERAAILSMLFFLCLFRFGTRAVWMALLPIGVGILRVVVGRAWPTDVAAGYLLGWFVATSVYLVRGNRVYAALDRYLEGSAAALAGERLVAYLRRKLSPLRAPLGGRHRRPLQLPGSVADHLRENWNITEAKLLAPPHKGKVFAIEVAGKRLGFKVSRKRAAEADQLTALLHMAADLRRKGVARTVPIVPTTNGGLVVPYGDRVAYLMEWVEGHPCDVADPEQRRSLFRLLARLHSETADLITDPPPSIATVVESEARAMSEALAVARPEIFRAFQALLPEGCEFSDQGSLVEEACRAEAIIRLALLRCVEDSEPMRRCHVHGDAHPMNFLCQEDGGLILLDYDTMRPGFAFEDLAMVLSRVMRLHNWRFHYFAEALDVYTSIRPLPRWEIVMLLGRITFPKVIEKWSRQRRNANPFGRRRHQLALLKDVMQNALSRGERDDFLRAAALRYGLDDLPLTLQPRPSGVQHTLPRPVTKPSGATRAVGLDN